MNIFLVDDSNEHSQSLIEKLCQARDNGIVPLTKGEMALYNSDGFSWILSGTNEAAVQAIKLEEGARYVFVCDQGTNLDDAVRVRDRMPNPIEIIRTK